MDEKFAESVIIFKCSCCNTVFGCKGYFSKSAETCKDCIRSDKCEIKKNHTSFYHYQVSEKGFCRECKTSPYDYALGHA